MSLSVKELKDFLKKSLDEAFNSKDDSHYGSILDIVEEDLKTKGYEVSIDQVEKGSWSSDGKYQELEDAVSCITIEGLKFYAGIGQSRTGSYHTDYYYNEPYLSFLMTEDVYNAPDPVTNFEYKGKTITIMTDKTAKIDDVSYETVEVAIDKILAS